MTTDAKGNLASDGGAIFNNINNLNSQIGSINQNLNQLNQDIKRLDGGIAMAMALGGAYLPEHQRFALHTRTWVSTTERKRLPCRGLRGSTKRSRPMVAWLTI